MKALRSLKRSLWVAGRCCGMPGATSAQDALRKPIATAVEIHESPVIDGRLDEGFWQKIQPVSDFVQREPEDGKLPSERTEVRIAFDEHFLYFGMQMFDSEPEKIRHTILQRDGATPQDDRIMIALDTYGDHRNGYIFEATPLGTQGDAIVTDESSTNWNWEGVFWTEARITSQG